MRMLLSCGSRRQSCFSGKGQTVTGRNMPTFFPALRASSTADMTARAVPPKQTTAVSASSIAYSSTRVMSSAFLSTLSSRRPTSLPAISWLLVGKPDASWALPVML